VAQPKPLGFPMYYMHAQLCTKEEAEEEAASPPGQGLPVHPHGPGPAWHGSLECFLPSLRWCEPPFAPPVQCGGGGEWGKACCIPLK
jgi:hypothetical protein